MAELPLRALVVPTLVGVVPEYVVLILATRRCPHASGGAVLVSLRLYIYGGQGGTMVARSGMGEVVEVYGDESLSRGGWDVYASLWLTPAGSAEVRAEVRRARLIHGLGGELKWTKASGSRVHPAYLDIVDVGIDTASRGLGEFRVLLIERAVAGHRVWRGRDLGAGVLREWEFLIGEFVNPGVRHVIYLDNRTLRDETRLRESRLALNRRYSHLIPAVPPPIAGMIMRSSDSDDVLQVVDLFAGAIGYHAARLHRRPDASPGKAELAEAIGRRLGRSDLSTPSRYGPVRVVRIRRAASRIVGMEPPVLVIDVEGLTEARQTRILTLHEVVAAAA